MKRWLVVAAALGAVAVAAVALVALGRGPEVTTSSPAALAEFNAAMDARMKLYHEETRQHLEQALVLDPDFVLAKLHLVDHLHGDKGRREQLLDEIAATDLEPLSERERFFVRRMLATRAQQPEEADRLVDEYLARHPKDPWALSVKASQAWGRGDMAEAERLNRRLVEVNPNWVIAYNMLGYGAMDQGRFAEAEEHFVSYRFIAPDQANPHDSLGELFILLGRYDEAVASLEESLRIKPDFWASYEHLALVYQVRRDWDAVERVLERMTSLDGHPKLSAEAIRCAAGIGRLEAERAWSQLVELAATSCPKGGNEAAFVTVTTHRALCLSGRPGEAEVLEGHVREALATLVGRSPNDAAMVVEGMLLHMEGVRRAVGGDLAGAADRLRAADGTLTYRTAGIGLLKLLNRGVLVEVLGAQGETAAADRLLDEVRAVNPSLVADHEAPARPILGLSGR